MSCELFRRAFPDISTGVPLLPLADGMSVKAEFGVSDIQNYKLTMDVSYCDGDKQILSVAMPFVRASRENDSGLTVPQDKREDTDICFISRIASLTPEAKCARKKMAVATRLFDFLEACGTPGVVVRSVNMRADMGGWDIDNQMHTAYMRLETMDMLKSSTEDLSVLRARGVDGDIARGKLGRDARAHFRSVNDKLLSQVNDEGVTLDAFKEAYSVIVAELVRCLGDIGWGTTDLSGYRVTWNHKSTAFKVCPWIENPTAGNFADPNGF
jgi:hypothetical protein